jgi:hypothetical protein
MQHSILCFADNDYFRNYDEFGSLTILTDEEIAVLRPNCGNVYGNLPRVLVTLEPDTAYVVLANYVLPGGEFSLFGVGDLCAPNIYYPKGNVFTSPLITTIAVEPSGARQRQ